MVVALSEVAEGEGVGAVTEFGWLNTGASLWRDELNIVHQPRIVLISWLLTYLATGKIRVCLHPTWTSLLATNNTSMPTVTLILFFVFQHECEWSR